MKALVDLVKRRIYLPTVDDKTAKYLYEELAVHSEGYQYSRAFRSKAWDGRVRFFNLFGKSAPLGLFWDIHHIVGITEVDLVLPPNLPEMHRQMMERYYKSAVNYKTYQEFMAASIAALPVPIEIPKVVGGKELRDYQYEAVAHAIRCGNGLIKIGTGGGKTLCYATIIKCYNLPSLIIVKGVSLMKQTHDELEKVFGKGKVGLIGEGILDVKYHNVASIDTLFKKVNNKKFMDALSAHHKVLILDEVHRAVAKTWAKVINKLRTPYMIGMSGTPILNRAHRDYTLKSICGEIFYEQTVKELQESGYLPKAELKFITVGQNPDDKGMKSRNFPGVIERQVVNNVYRTDVIARIIRKKIKQGKKILVLYGNSLAYGRTLYEYLLNTCENSNKVVLLSGKHDTTKRKYEMRRLDAGKINCILSSPIFDEGIDISSVDVVILAMPMRSYRLVLQRIGRGMRPKDTPLEVYDFADLAPYLIDHALERLKIYKTEDMFQKVIFYELEGENTWVSKTMDYNTIVKTLR